MPLMATNRALSGEPRQCAAVTITRGVDTDFAALMFVQRCHTIEDITGTF